MKHFLKGSSQLCPEMNTLKHRHAHMRRIKTANQDGNAVNTAWRHTSPTESERNWHHEAGQAKKCPHGSPDIQPHNLHNRGAHHTKRAGRLASVPLLEPLSLGQSMSTSQVCNTSTKP
ncbi:unnamed protein product [Symbiodinium natans]|uniref:Uncharacterized protein n=1 Tax=Symbiodinium natans TaxID=878477 RepID=A0A812Q0C6_9DINO|nr:unnamed protein product [Symbiodinium natans]